MLKVKVKMEKILSRFFYELSHRVTEWQSHRVTDTQGYSVYGGGWNFFVPDFNIKISISKLKLKITVFGQRDTS